MRLTDNPGRVAGFWYLLLVILGPLRLIYIPEKLFVPGNAAATANNIVAHEQLFRLGVAGDLLGAVVLVLMTLAFYRLFAGIDGSLAVMVVIFGGVMPATLYFVGVICDLGALMAVKNGDFLLVFDQTQRDALAMIFLKLHDYDNTAAETLWGVWLFPLAALAYRSRFLPRFLGVWLALGGVGWVALSFTTVLWPESRRVVYAVSQPATIGEMVFPLWLVVRGARPSANGKTRMDG